MIKFSQSQLKKEMKKLYPAPAPQKRETFLKGFPFPKTSPLETLAVQIGYIRKTVWLLSLLLVIAALMTGEYLLQEDSRGKLWCLSGVMPLLAVLTVTETFRSSAYGMAELEMTTRHNLPRILLIRMGALGAGNLLMIISGLLPVVRQGTLSLFRGTVYLTAPWICTCVLALQIEKYVKGRESIWYCCVCGCFLWGISLPGGKLREIVYDEEKFYLWITVLSVSAVCLAGQLRQIRHEEESWKQNLI